MAAAASRALYSFSIDRIEDLVTEDRFGWVYLTIAFEDPITRARPAVKIQVPIQYQHSWTVDKVRHEALAMARHILAQATDLLASHDLERLQQLGDELEASRAR